MRRRRDWKPLFRWILLRVLGADGLSSGFQCFRLGVPVHLPQQVGIILEAGGHVGVLRPQSLLINRQRALVERLGLGVHTLVEIHRRQVVEALRRSTSF